MKTANLLNEKLELVTEISSLKLALNQKSGLDSIGGKVGVTQNNLCTEHRGASNFKCRGLKGLSLGLSFTPGVVVDSNSIIFPHTLDTILIYSLQHSCGSSLLSSMSALLFSDLDS